MNPLAYKYALQDTANNGTIQKHETKQESKI